MNASRLRASLLPSSPLLPSVGACPPPPATGCAGRPWQLVDPAPHTALPSLFPPSGVHRVPAPPPITRAAPVPTTPRCCYHDVVQAPGQAVLEPAGAVLQPLSSKAGIKRCGCCKPRPLCWNGGYVVLRRANKMLEPALAGATISGIFCYNCSFVLLELATFFARICNLRCFLLEPALIFATTVYDFCYHRSFLIFATARL